MSPWLFARGLAVPWLFARGLTAARHQRARVVVAVLLGLVACACERAQLLPGVDGDPLRPPFVRGLPTIDLRRLEDRPRLARIVRSGDPAPALVLAVAAELGPAGNSAIAAVMEARLRRRSVEARALADGVGFRLVIGALDPDRFVDLLSSLASVMSTPVTAAEDLGAAKLAVRALWRRPLDGAALAPIAACSAEAAVLGSEPEPRLDGSEGADDLERWRRSLTSERMSIAFVGPREPGEALSLALEKSGGWPRGPGAEPRWPSSDQHGAYPSGELAQGRARLDVAVRLPSAARAVNAVKRLAAPRSALALKLDAREKGWGVAWARATAHPFGGCVRLRLVPHGSAQLSELAGDAAGVLALVEREIELLARLGDNTFEVTREIISASDAGETAARAAWWALNADFRGGEARIASALAASAHGKEIDNASLEQLDLEYRRAVADAPRLAGNVPIAARAHSVELGQGEVWVLVGSPCALLSESAWDAGRAALGAAVAASSARSESGVLVSPWATEDGVGVMAHASIRSAAETPVALARRVAREAAMSFMTIARSNENVGLAKRSLLTALKEHDGEERARWALALLPAHPSWLAPWGAPSDHAGTGLPEIGARWRAIVHSPVRVAMIANSGEEQARAVFDEVDRWLPIEARSRPCSEVPRPSDAPPSSSHGDAPPGRLFIGVLLAGGPHSAAFAELTAAALDGDAGLIRRAVPVERLSVHVVGSRRARALWIDVALATGDAGDASERITGVLTGMAASLTDAERSRATREAARRLERRLADPGARVSALWRGERGEPPQPNDEWPAWLGRTFRKEALVVIGGK